MCATQYFFEYVLGIRQDTNRKALMGTVVHKCLEILAKKKKCQQDRKAFFIDDALGKFDNNMWRPYINDLAQQCFDYYKHEVDPELSSWEFGKCKNWVWECIKYKGGIYDPRKANIVAPEQRFDIVINEPWAKYEYEHAGVRMVGNLAIKGTIDLITSPKEGVIESVDYKGLPLDTPIPTANGWRTMGQLEIGDVVYDQYAMPCRIVGKSGQKLKDCYKITFGDATDVICDFEHYWKLSNGEVKSTLELRPGDTIGVNTKRVIEDILPVGKMVTQCISVDSDDNTYLCTENMIPTHNSGQRKDWATGKEKTYNKLLVDNQLLLYYYAMKQLYPKHKAFMSTIYFIEHGGPYTISFEDHDLIRASKMLRSFFQRIRDTKVPDIVYPSFKCDRLCHFFKHRPDGTKNTSKTYDDSMCKFIHDKIKEEGIDSVTEKYGKGQFDYYSPPG